MAEKSPFIKPLNQKMITAKMTRRDFCNLALACTLVANSIREDKEALETLAVYDHLHDQIVEIIAKFDSENGC